MSTPTYDLIETTTLASAASSVTFSSITQDYRDLVLVITATSTDGGGFIVRINGDSATNYYFVQMIATSSSVIAGSNFSNKLIASFVGSSPVIQKFEFLDYSATDKHKSVLLRSGTATNDTRASAQRWENTSTITSLDCIIESNTFDTGSTFSLYGIAS